MELLKELFAIIIVVAIAAVFVKMIINSVNSVIERKRSPVLSVTAEVKAKNADVGLGELKDDGLRLGKHLYTAVFELDGGESITLELSKDDYDKLEEGTRGCLNYRENVFFGFTVDSLI